MTIPRLTALFDQWADEPPTNRLVAAFLGVKKKVKGNASDLLNMFPTGVIR